MFTKKLLLWTGMLFVLVGCTSRSEYQLLQTDKNITEKSVNVTDRSIEYRILPQDRLDVSLYKDPEQSQNVTGELGQSMKGNGILVNASGYIPLPLIGKIKVAGLSQTQAAEKISQEYKKYLNTPSVYVEVLNKRLFVLGEVKSPGVVKIDKEKMTLFEALANVGDFTDSAVKNNIIILSNSPEKGMQIRSVDLTNFDNMHYAGLMLRPNDIVYVQPNGWKEFKVASNNFTSPFELIAKIAAPFVTLKYLED